MSPMDNTAMYGYGSTHAMYANKRNRRSPAKGGARKKRARSPDTRKRQADKAAALRARRDSMYAAASASMPMPVPTPVAAKAPRRITPIRISPPAANPEALKMRKIAFLDAELRKARGPMARVLMAERAKLGGYTPPARKSKSRGSTSAATSTNPWIRWMYPTPSACAPMNAYRNRPGGMSDWRQTLKLCSSGYKVRKQQLGLGKRPRSPVKKVKNVRRPGGSRVKTKTVAKKTGATHIRFPQQYGSKSCGSCGSCK